MSAIHDPLQKKRLSYLRDRRLDGFDNLRGARLAIPLNKRRVNKVNRLAVANVLAQIYDLEDVEDIVDEIDRRRPKRWKKVPATPLAYKVADRSGLARKLVTVGDRRKAS